MKKNALSCCLLEFNVAPFHLQRSAFGFVQDLLGGAHFAPGILCVLGLIFSCRQHLESFGSGLVRGFFVSWTFFFPQNSWFNVVEGFLLCFFFVLFLYLSFIFLLNKQKPFTNRILSYGHMQELCLNTSVFCGRLNEAELHIVENIWVRHNVSLFLHPIQAPMGHGCRAPCYSAGFVQHCQQHGWHLWAELQQKQSCCL